MVTGHPRGTSAASLLRVLAPLVSLSLIAPLTACTEAPPAPPAMPTINQGQPPNQAPPSNVVGGFSIQLPEQTVKAGQERFPCWIFPIELTGPSGVVGGGKLVTGPGMHHGNITTRTATGEGIRPCSGNDGDEATDILDGGAVLFGSSTQVIGEEWQSFPDGMGFPIHPGHEIVARMHYLNAGSEDMTVAPRYEWYTIDEAQVSQLLGPFAWWMSGWEIPPQSDFTVTSDCRPPREMHVVSAMPHMHALGTEFFAGFIGGQYDGQRFLDSQGYDPDGGVIRQYQPAINLHEGDFVRFGCSWRNTFDKPIVEGVGDNEMCILFGYAYPYENSFSAAANAGGCAMASVPPFSDG